jgi:hypothetical protein
MAGDGAGVVVPGGGGGGSAFAGVADSAMATAPALVTEAIAGIAQRLFRRVEFGSSWAIAKTYRDAGVGC